MNHGRLGSTVIFAKKNYNKLLKLVSFSQRDSPYEGMDREWQLGKTLAECNRYMLDNQIDCDVTFRVGEIREVVMAHKYVLGSRSSVFYAMLYGPLAEKGDILITDMEPHTFQCLLR